MKLDDGLLVAYLDGELNDEDQRRVETALREDPETSDRMEHLASITTDDIKAALELDTPEHVPPALARRVGGMTLEADIAVPGPAYPRWLIAASIAFCIIFTGLGYTVGAWQPTQETPVAMAKSWILQVAEYQVLYGRETVSNAKATPATMAETTRRLSQRLGRPVVPPDLTEHDLEFKRGQLLFRAGQPIAQLVYLPKAGKPIALCIMATVEGNLAPSPGMAEGLRFTHWRDNGFAYILIGDSAPIDVDAMARTARRQLLAG